jgi:hypothetical protein
MQKVYSLAGQQEPLFIERFCASGTSVGALHIVIHLLQTVNPMW